MLRLFHSNRKFSILKNLQTESLLNALRRLLLMCVGFDYFSNFDLFVVSWFLNENAFKVHICLIVFRIEFSFISLYIKSFTS